MSHQRKLVKKLGDIPKEITDAIYTYGVAVEVASEEAIQKSAKQTKNFMKRKSVTPLEERQRYSKGGKKGGGKPLKHYRTMFKIYSPRKKRKDYHWRVVGNQYYRLDHLLEDGHVVYNGAGGPHPIDNAKRVRRGIPESGYVTDETTYYKLWNKGYKFADASFYGDLLDILEASGCISK